VKRIPLPSGTYLINFGISEGTSWSYDKDVCLMEIKPRDIYDCGVPPQDKYAVAVSDYYWE
jgi:hypothetical protein